ncbi:hypothetical protein CRE_03386 [Caenorhabditis remanei]|uniref:Uncharacterized protein n=1 Tax=Caenorhabditis remanei TaxID=31234 RepID=E3N659_CAERE|nr:hypothetical protein CRE_03386 [Caenorhabditis remanei]
MQETLYTFPISFEINIISKFEVFLIQKSNCLPPIHGISITSATITAGSTIIGVAVKFTLDWQRSVQTHAEMRKSKEIIAKNSNNTLGLTKQQEHHNEEMSSKRLASKSAPNDDESDFPEFETLALCLICTAHFVRPRKFYEYDVVLMKKKLENQSK